MSLPLDRLNPEQLQAVTSESPVILCLAGAGSGKTSVLTMRIAYLQLHERVGTSNMLALTFTRLAAAEMKARVGKLVGGALAKKLTAGTFHAFCTQILRRHGEKVGLSPDFTVYDQEDRRDLLTAVRDDLRYNLRLADLDPWAPAEGPAGEIAAEYRYRLRQSNAVDLDGLLVRTVEVLSQYPNCREDLHSQYTRVFVDEYQDTDGRQEEILRLLDPEHLFVVGDPAQSIYGWRGAMIENILTFEERHPGCEVIRLERNYRSTKPILNVANRVIAAAKHKSPLRLWSDKDGPSPEVRTSDSDAYEAIDTARFLTGIQRETGAAWSDMAVLCRTNNQVALMDTALRAQGAPTFVLNQANSPFSNYDVRRILDYMTVICNPRDERSLRRILNWPKRRLSELDVARVEQQALDGEGDLQEKLYAASRLGDFLAGADQAMDSAESLWDWVVEHLDLPAIYDGLSLRSRLSDLDVARSSIVSWQANQEQLGEPIDPLAFLRWLRTRDIQDRLAQEQADGVRILTVHAAKGLEWDHVFVIGCNDGMFPSKRSEPEEERRLFYVAVTRARDGLSLSYSLGRELRNGHLQQLQPSPFLYAARCDLRGEGGSVNAE